VTATGASRPVVVGVVLADEDDRARAVGDGTGVVEVQRFGDRRRLQHVLDGDLPLVLRVVVTDGVRVVLHRDVREVLVGPAELREVGVRHHRVRAGERHAGPHFVQFVGGDGQRLRRLRRLEVVHPLGAADDEDVLLTVAHVPDGLPERHAAGRTGALVARRGASTPRASAASGPWWPWCSASAPMKFP